MRGSHTRHGIILVFGLLFGLVHWPRVLAAAPPTSDLTVEAEGLASSRDRALLDAKRQAVEQGIGTVLLSQTEVKNFALHKDIVLTKTLGSVRRYTILEEKERPDALYDIRIRAVVSLASIKSDLAALKILLESMDKPRMMVIVQEDHGPTAATAIADYLKTKEFDLVDPALVAALLRKETPFIQQILNGDTVAAAKLGSENGAEYLLLGNVSTHLQQSDFLTQQGMASRRAAITARIIDCSTARVIAAKSAQHAAIHASADAATTTAVEQAALKLMDQALFETVVASFQDMVNNGMLLAVTINNIANFRTQQAVREALQGLPAVVSVHGHRFSQGQLHLSVHFQGDANMFGNAVDGLAVSGQTLAVTAIAGNAVTVQLE